MKKSLLWITILVICISMVAAFSLAGCKTTASATTAAETTAAVAETTAAAETTTAAETTKVEGKKMGITYYTSENPNLLAILKGAKEEAEKLGYTVYMADAQFDVEKQLSDVENFIQLGVDVVLINPVDSAGVTPTVEACNNAKIPVVMLDIDAKGGVRAAHVTSDNEAMGRYGGEYLAWALKGVGKIAILDYPQLDIVKERSDACRKVISFFPEMEIVATEIAVIRSQGLEKMENIIQANPDLSGVYCINDGGGLGAFFAAKAANRDDFIITSVDGDPESVVLIQAGTNYKLDTAHHALILGRTTVDVADKIVNGEEVPYKTVVPVYPITNDNYESYPGWGGTELPPNDKLIPSWYKEDSWKALVEKYNYTDWQKTIEQFSK